MRVKFIGNLQITIFEQIEAQEKRELRNFKVNAFVDNNKIISIHNENKNVKTWKLYDVFQTLTKINYPQYDQDTISDIAIKCAEYALRLPIEKYTRPYFVSLLKSRAINYHRDGDKGRMIRAGHWATW